LIEQITNQIKPKPVIMKKTISLVLAFIAILIIACNNQRKLLLKILCRCLEITHSKYVYPDTTYETTPRVNLM